MPKILSFDQKYVRRARGENYLNRCFKFQRRLCEAVATGGSFNHEDVRLWTMDYVLDLTVCWNIVNDMVRRHHLSSKKTGESYEAGPNILVESTMPVYLGAANQAKPRLNEASTAYQVCQLILDHNKDVRKLSESFLYNTIKANSSVSLVGYPISRIAGLCRHALEKGYLVREKTSGQDALYSLGPNFPDVAYQFVATDSLPDQVRSVMQEFQRQLKLSKPTVTIRMPRDAAKWLSNALQRLVETDAKGDTDV